MMNSKLAIVLCLIGMMGIFGGGIAGNLDDARALTVSEEAPSDTACGSPEWKVEATFPAPVEKTGQTKTYGPRDDGKLRRGVAWPTPRFSSRTNGTVKDNLTGLIWLRKADCFESRSWNQALSDANNLASGSCGLTDGSKAGDWRLPNAKELKSLIDYNFVGPAVSNSAGTGKWTEGKPFFGMVSDYYWSSTTYADLPDLAWVEYLRNGESTTGRKTDSWRVWPVRGGQ